MQASRTGRALLLIYFSFIATKGAAQTFEKEGPSAPYDPNEKCNDGECLFIAQFSMHVSLACHVPIHILRCVPQCNPIPTPCNIILGFNFDWKRQMQMYRGRHVQLCARRRWRVVPVTPGTVVLRLADWEGKRVRTFFIQYILFKNCAVNFKINMMIRIWNCHTKYAYILGYMYPCGIRQNTNP